MMAQNGPTRLYNCVRHTLRGNDGQGVLRQGWLVSPKHGGPVRPADCPRRAGASAPGPRRALPEYLAARVQPGSAVARGDACGRRARHGRVAGAVLDPNRLLSLAPVVPERGGGPHLSAGVTRGIMPNTWTVHHIHFLTQPELRALFRVITRQRDRALFLVAYRHGLRASEVGLLQVDDLNLAQQRLTVR